MARSRRFPAVAGPDQSHGDFGRTYGAHLHSRFPKSMASGLTRQWPSRYLGNSKKHALAVRTQKPLSRHLLGDPGMRAYLITIGTTPYRKRPGNSLDYEHARKTPVSPEGAAPLTEAHERKLSRDRLASEAKWVEASGFDGGPEKDHSHGVPRTQSTCNRSLVI